MFLLNNIKILIITAFISFLTPGASKALNLFEMFMIKTGVVLVYYQYNDKSLNYDSVLEKKNAVLANFNNNRIYRIKSERFNNLPLQQKLLVIEELNLQK